MKSIVITVDLESDGAAFGDPRIKTFRGIKEGVPKFLNFLSEHDYPATFFISCDVLSALDIDLLKSNLRLVEIGSHGLVHPYPPYFLSAFSPYELSKTAIESKDSLEKVFIVEVRGFRSPGSFMNTEIMNTVSKYYAYDSSMILNFKYGTDKLKVPYPYRPHPQNVCKPGNHSIIEFPISSFDLKIRVIPAVGSYIRILPLFFFKFSYPLIVLDLHCQDPVSFKHMKYINAKKYFKKLCRLILFYNVRGYEVRSLREIYAKITRCLRANRSDDFEKD